MFNISFRLKALYHGHQEPYTFRFHSQNMESMAFFKGYLYCWFMNQGLLGGEYSDVTMDNVRVTPEKYLEPALRMYLQVKNKFIDERQPRGQTAAERLLARLEAAIPVPQVPFSDDAGDDDDREPGDDDLIQINVAVPQVFVPADPNVTEVIAGETELVPADEV